MSSIYHDASSDGLGLVAFEDDDEFFFDVEQWEEEEEEENGTVKKEKEEEEDEEEVSTMSMPIPVEDQEAHRKIRSSLVTYPIVTTAEPPPTGPVEVSLDKPETLMVVADDGDMNMQDISVRERHSESKSAAGDRLRVPTLLAKRSVPNAAHLEQHLLAIESSVHKDCGYPGSLTREEVQACIHLAAELAKPENAMLASNVYQYVDFGVELKPYALCRFLRPFQFQVEGVVRNVR